MYTDNMKSLQSYFMFTGMPNNPVANMSKYIGYIYIFIKNKNKQLTTYKM